MFRAAWAPIAHGELGLAQLTEMIEVAPSGNPAEPRSICDGGGRKPRLGPAQGLQDQVKRGFGQSLRQRLVAGTSQHAEDPVHVALLCAGQMDHPIVSSCI